MRNDNLRDTVVQPLVDAVQAPVCDERLHALQYRQLWRVLPHDEIRRDGSETGQVSLPPCREDEARGIAAERLERRPIKLWVHVANRAKRDIDQWAIA